MNSEDILSMLLRSFERYYDVKNNDVPSPFSAEAEFHSRDEQYFLVRSAHISEVVSNEYVFFAREEQLGADRLDVLVSSAWERGLCRVKIVPGHRNSDVTLIVLADEVQDGLFGRIKKTRRYKSYCFSLRGWSSFNLVVMEISSGTVVANRRAAALKKNLGKIFATIHSYYSL